jgi:SH3-like domain-containing protein
MKTTTAGLLVGLSTLASPALSLDFITTSRPAILFDAPSQAAKKVSVVSSGYPLERIVSTEGWVKVRDDSGSLSWIEESAISNQRSARISVPIALILQKPVDNAVVLFRAAQGVTLEIQAIDAVGWARVRLPEGKEGYLRSRDAWGL